MNGNRSNLEPTANFILNELRKNPDKTLKELHILLQQNEKIPVVRLQVLGTYLHKLHKEGYVKRTITHPHRYKLGKTPPPFKSTIPINTSRHKKPEKPLEVHKPKQIVVKRRNSVPMDVYRENRKKDVEIRANIILPTIREYPNKTQKQLLSLLNSNNKEFMTLKRMMFSNYIRTLHEQGYIQRIGKRFSKYVVVKDTPFTYVPVSIYNPKRQREI